MSNRHELELARANLLRLARQADEIRQRIEERLVQVEIALAAAKRDEDYVLYPAAASCCLGNYWNPR
jgi:hypothetical protein